MRSPALHFQQSTKPMHFSSHLFWSFDAIVDRARIDVIVGQRLAVMFYASYRERFLLAQQASDEVLGETAASTLAQGECKGPGDSGVEEQRPIARATSS